MSAALHVRAIPCIETLASNRMTSQSDLPPLPSNRKFGVTFACVFALAAGYSYFKGAAPAWPVASGLLALLFGAVALAIPAWLEPLNKLWMRLGVLLGKI